MLNSAANAQTRQAICGKSNDIPMTTINSNASSHHNEQDQNQDSSFCATDGSKDNSVENSSGNCPTNVHNDHSHNNNNNSTASNNSSMPDSPTLVKVKTWYTVAKQGVSC